MMSSQDPDQAPKDSSPDSDSNKSNTVPKTKRRASRAGTRSVSTLTQAQLERKRANDREAQRAIRQRTKERIEGLESKIGELTGRPNSSEQLVAALRRSKELEEENAYLRSRLEHAGIPISSDRAGSWEGLAANRPMPPHIQLPSQRGDSAGLIARRSSEDQSDPYGYPQSSQWPTANPFPGESRTKSESSASPEAQLSPHGFSAWPVDRGHAVGQTDRGELSQPAEYPHMIGTQPYPISISSSHGPPGAPLAMQPQGPTQYGPVHQQYAQQVQPHHHAQRTQPEPSRSLPSQTTHGSQRVFYGNFPPPS